MSGLSELLCGVFYGTMDMVSGGTIAFLSDTFFSRAAEKALSLKDGNSDMNKILRLWLQGMFTALAAHSTRSFLYSKESIEQDPLGGMLFLMTIIIQPTFWKQLEDIKLILVEKLYGRIAKADDMKNAVPLHPNGLLRQDME